MSFPRQTASRYDHVGCKAKGDDPVTCSTVAPARTITADEFRQGMRRLPSGVGLVTAAFEGQWRALVATAIASVTAEPPTLLVCVNRTASIRPHLDAAPLFCVNLLGEAQGELARHMADPACRERRFETGSWTAEVGGPPELLDAEVRFLCRRERTLDHGTHRLVFGRVLEMREGAGAPAPLVWLDGASRRLAAEQAA
jgi:flavin reductase